MSSHPDDAKTQRIATLDIEKSQEAGLPPLYTPYNAEHSVLPVPVAWPQAHSRRHKAVRVLHFVVLGFILYAMFYTDVIQETRLQRQYKLILWSVYRLILTTSTFIVS